jgi:phosphohistidine swiveling domain-containing protein
VTGGDPLHQPGGPATFWTTVNAEENLPGVTYPLAASFWMRPVSVGTLGAFADLGVIPEEKAAFNDAVDGRVATVINGRLVANIDLLRECADRTPGTSGDALEEQLFSGARPGIPSRRSIARYPIVALRAPRAAAAVARRIKREFDRSQRWWRESIAAEPGDDVQRSRWRLAQAQDHMAAMMRPHTLGTFITQGVYDQLKALAAGADRPGFEVELSGGVGSIEETEMLARMWEVAHGRAELDGLLADYGFHGPAEGDPASFSWREDARSLESALVAYAAMPEERSPSAVARAVAERRRAAAAELLAGLPRAKRPAGRLLLRLTDVYWPLRETGKATLLHAIDVGRAAVHRLSAGMAEAGRIEDPADVAFLTVDELVGDRGTDWRAAVVFRRSRREGYLGLELPQAWEGVPEPVIAKRGAAGPVTELVAAAGSAGVAEGRVRVIHDPSGVELGEGEVIVCTTTDPSWAALLFAASAAVIDVGGPMSHGAIVARELGLPCVINTRTGTRVLKDGDLVRVDGGAGRVELLNGAKERE